MSSSPLTALPARDGSSWDGPSFDGSSSGGRAWGVRNRELWDRTAAVAGRLNRAQAELVDIISEVMTDRHWGEGGFKSPEHYLVVRAGLSHAHAADVVQVARRRAELTDAAAALDAGELSLDQVAVLARHVPASHQASVTGFARNATVTQLRRALARHAFPTVATTPDGAGGAGACDDGGAHAEADPEATSEDAAPDPRTRVQSDLDAARAAAVEQRACARPDLSMSYDADGRFQLRYSAPATIGALVEQAIKEAKDALFTRRAAPTDNNDDGSGDALAQAPDITARKSAAGDRRPDGAAIQDRYAGLPTYADALEEMATRSLASITSTSRSAHYRVYLHLDTGGAWANGGHAIPRRLLTRFISDGVAQPVWETDAKPVSVGRAMRILPERSRRLILDRDRGCRFPGCPTTGFVEIHHLHAWADGGGTDADNQVSLCTAHHDGITRGDYTLTGDPSRPDGLTVVNRYGLPIRPPRPHETAPPPSGDPEVPVGIYTPPTGEPLRWHDVALPTDHELQHGTIRPPGLTLVPPEPPEPYSWLDDPANPDRGLIRVL